MNLLELRPVAAETATTLLVHFPSEIFFPIDVFSTSTGLCLKKQKIGKFFTKNYTKNIIAVTHKSLGTLLMKKCSTLAITRDM